MDHLPRNIWLENPPYYLSAYEIAVKHGYVGTETEWLETLQGASAYEVAVANGFVGTEEQWLASLKATVIIDPLPTLNSDNVPRSGGVYDLWPKVLGGDGSLVPCVLLTQEEYDDLKDAGQISETTLYMVYEAGVVNP